MTHVYVGLNLRSSNLGKSGSTYLMWGLVYIVSSNKNVRCSAYKNLNLGKRKAMRENEKGFAGLVKNKERVAATSKGTQGDKHSILFLSALLLRCC